MTSVRPKDHVDAVPREKIRNVQEPVRNLLKSIAARSGVNVIDALDFLCSDGKCMVVMPDGRPIYKDGVHMRPFYVLERAGFMDRTIFLDELPRR